VVEPGGGGPGHRPRLPHRPGARRAGAQVICGGTFEESLDQLIERKVALAQTIVGAGEAWIRDLRTAELRDLLALRRSDAGVLTR
jgi:hypothetical protein